MIRDINTKKVMKNAYRITKNRYQTSLRVRVPGGAIDPECLNIVAQISQKFGDGEIHITTRQGFEILGLRYEDIDEINKIDNFEDVLLIPLGRAVEEVLCKLKDENLIKENQILMGFPHPSGANVNRLVQLEQNKEEMINFLKKRTVS